MKNVQKTMKTEDQKTHLGGEVYLEVHLAKPTGVLAFAKQLIQMRWERLLPKTKVLFVRED